MKKCWFMGLIAILTCIVSPSQGQDNKTLIARSIADSPSFVKRALVIGIGEYEHAPSLAPATYNDAKNFAQLLKTRFKFTDEAITILTDAPGTPERQRPSFLHILNAIKSLLAGINEKSEVVIYFSGHGIRVQDHDWLVPMDGVPADVASTCINYDDFKSKLNTELPARALLIIDACRNIGTGKDVVSSGFGGSKGLTSPQFAELLSCRPKEESKLGKAGDFSESVFTHFLLKGLNGDPEAQDMGLVTFDSLNQFVQGKVSQYVMKKYGEAQNPEGRASLGKMLLARAEESPIPPPDNNANDENLTKADVANIPPKPLSAQEHADLTKVLDELDGYSSERILSDGVTDDKRVASAVSRAWKTVRGKQTYSSKSLGEVSRIDWEIKLPTFPVEKTSRGKNNECLCSYKIEQENGDFWIGLWYYVTLQKSFANLKEAIAWGKSVSALLKEQGYEDTTKDSSEPFRHTFTKNDDKKYHALVVAAPPYKIERAVVLIALSRRVAGH